MAIEFVITGDNSGLVNAVNQSRGILEGLQNIADGLKIDLFKATSVDDINNIGAALTRVTGNIKDYVNAAVKGSQAWKDQQGASALDALSTKLLAITGNAQLFGASIKNQQQEINAYQAAISRLLSAGYDPMDREIQDIKSKMDALTASIQQQNAALTQSKFVAQFQDTGGLILDAQRKVDRLGQALQNATSERQIVQYNLRLREAEAELARLTTLGNSASTATNNLGNSANRAGRQFSSVGIEFSRIIQDAPYAFKALGAGQNNFGAIGNNITRLTELIPGYILQLQAAIVAQGGVATSANVAKAAFAGLFTGFGGIVLAVSLAVSAFTVYQAVQQRNAREIENNANAIQKQKKALDDYILTLGNYSRVQAEAASGYSNELAKLDILYAAVVKNTSARYENGTAIQELQKLYPDVFGSLKENEFLTTKAANAYYKLRDGIIASGLAAAALKLSGDAIESQVKNTVALTKATETQRIAQEKFNAAQEAYDKLRFSSKGTSAGGNGNSELDAASQAAGEAKQNLEAATDAVETYRIAIFQAKQQIADYKKVAADAFANDKQPKKSGIIFDLEERLKQLQNLRPTIKIKADLDLNTAEIKKVQDELDKLGGTKGTKKAPADTSAQNQLSLSENLRRIQQQSSSGADQSGLEGLALSIQKIDDTYKKLFADLDALEQRTRNNTKITETQRTADLAAEEKTRQQLQLDQATQVTNAVIKESQRTQAEVNRINGESGVQASLTRAKELQAIQLWYDAEVFKAKNNEDILEALRQGRLAKIQAVNDKYDQVTTDLYFKIGQIEDQANAAGISQDENRTQTIINEWEKRRKAANDYYKQLLQLNASTSVAGDQPSVSNGLTGINAARIKNDQAKTNAAITKGENFEVAKQAGEDLSRELSRGITSFGQSFLQTFTTFNEQADHSFGTILSSLTSKLNSSLSDIFLNTITKGLAKSLSDAISQGLSSQGGGLSGTVGIAGAGILAGGLVSGLTSKKSSIGQGLGGALSGAGSGALIGSAVPGIGTAAGAIVGGVVGLAGGLFGSKKARKQAEDLQKQQLEEAKKQTALLRQQALAYTSSIIGKQTVNGVITGVDINGFGQLTATVSGKDLQFVLDRNNNSR